MPSPPPRPRALGWTLAGLVVATLGVTLRLHNAFDYPAGKGFDAAANWEYVALLLESWSLPAPDSLWAASHPPLYYWLAATTGRAVGGGEEAALVPWIRLAGAVLGMLSIGLATLLVQRLSDDPRRTFLAGALLWLLPVHLYSSAMLNEEIVAAAFVTAALFALIVSREGDAPPAWGPVLAVGGLAGLAFLTKVSGALVIATAALTYAIDGWRQGRVTAGLARAVTVGVVGGLVGGWFFLHNLWAYGYLYPYKLDVHAIMATMPPGARSLGDYLTLPLATFVQPVVIAPDLVRSVWGGTYATLWFDAHYHFLPRPRPGLLGWGTALTALGLVPTAAFAIAAARAVRRSIGEPRGHDLPLLLYTGITLAGYVAFTWRNPWFPTVKASYLLGLALPFAVYASEALASGVRPDRWTRWPLAAGLAALGLVSTLVFTHGLLFAKHDDPGVPWRMRPPAEANVTR